MHYNHHHHHHLKVLSTGVLTREPDTVCAVVNILNPDHYDHNVKVDVNKGTGTLFTFLFWSKIEEK